MPVGGLFLLHDYSSKHWAGAKLAIDEFCKASGEYVICMPDKSGSAFLRKTKAYSLNRCPHSGRLSIQQSPGESHPMLNPDLPATSTAETNLDKLYEAKAESIPVTEPKHASKEPTEQMLMACEPSQSWQLSYSMRVKLHRWLRWCGCLLRHLGIFDFWHSLKRSSSQQFSMKVFWLVASDASCQPPPLCLLSSWLSDFGFSTRTH